ncbi:uncharacterized protein PITG_17519 [Phytophthora infestans T30-4]|uniref:Uncharacterized protein n=1 Tax=Phytophthora infestans (strain T30-4) TaxID=403677 RepID=D0NWH1_PHYIT|nr:uncharacterized protein PITG_17519 [Phytophthora infestans T30-4]EEY67027.1 conserved hypothetical protein [Phytophthora infestans T30-4]|eukprot:XP_002896581.1 conserved hypothetical protein [Phytophthora infestans T30-4]
MSFPVLLNVNNQVAQHQCRYRLSQPIDFSQFECALGSISMYYSWKAITAQRQNNLFKIIWPTAATTTTCSITLPDGTYSASDINNYLQHWSIQNNLNLATTRPIDNSGFGAIVGLSNGVYPAAQTTSVYAINSNVTPMVDPVAAVILGLSNLYNPIASNNQALHTFTSAGVGFGGLITTSQGQGIAYYMRSLQIFDPNVCIRLLMRQNQIYDSTM